MTDLTYDLLKSLSADVKELNKNYARIAVEFSFHSLSQTAVRAEMDNLKSDIASVKSDVAEIKIQKRVSAGYFAGLVTFAGAIASALVVVGKFFFEKYMAM